MLDAHGDLGGTVERKMSRTDDYIKAFTAAGSGRNQYTRPRTVTNVGVACQFRPRSASRSTGATSSMPRRYFYRRIADQISEYRIPGTTVTFGVSGRF